MSSPFALPNPITAGTSSHLTGTSKDSSKEVDLKDPSLDLLAPSNL